MYRIRAIFKDGVPRTDGRYPLRIGCTGMIKLLMHGASMLFEYRTDQVGLPKGGTLQTSIVLDFHIHDGAICVNTMNSRYILEPLN